MRDGWDLERIDGGVAVQGEIDLATAGDLAEALYDAAATTDTGFLIDLTQVTFIDSTGIDALTRVLNVHADTCFVIVPSNQVFTLLHLSGLTNGAWPNVKCAHRRTTDREEGSRRLLTPSSGQD